MISNNMIKTVKPNIIINYLKKQNTIPELPKNSWKIYKQIIQNKYKHYIKIGQSHWNQYPPQIPWNELWKSTFYSYNWPENFNILYLLLHYATSSNDQIYKWTNQKHLKSPNCKLCDKTENITHIYIDCKRNHKNLEVFPKTLSNSHTKTKYTITTYPNNIIFVTTIKNKETNPSTNNCNTNPHMENKKQTTIRWYNHSRH